MNQRKYNISMSTPMGVMRGTLTLKDEGGTLRGNLDVMGLKQPVNGTVLKDGTLELSGKITVLVQTFQYKAKGRVSGSKISLEVFSEGKRFHISGDEIK